MPEFAFIGRSNAGKSSLLNMLTGDDRLAKVSNTPGSTKLINFFKINNRWRLVDLPGYGYAHAAKKEKFRFNRAVTDYLQGRPNLVCVFSLIDSGLPPQPIDLQFVEWLVDNAVPFVLVFTKTDKVKPGRVQANISKFTDHISEWSETLPEVFTCSAVKRHGRRELLDMIGEALEEVTVQPDVPWLQEAVAEETGSIEDTAEEVEPSPKAPGGKSKKRPNPARPW